MEEQTDISEKRREDVSNLDVVDINSRSGENVLQSVDLNENLQKQCSHQTCPVEEESWWRADLSLLSPKLFGAWDGVFTSCMVNIFGVVIFLRTGWIVGNAGLDFTFIIIALTESVSLVTVFSAIGICHKGQVECTGGVYTLICHVLGSKVATPVALLYCLGQAISCSLCVLAFGESILDLLSWKNIWLERLIACTALLFILGVLALGVTWLIGLQILLIILLFIAILDFLLGSFITKDPGRGVVGYSKEQFLNNTGPEYLDGENFFSVLGVFFPMSCGVLAGFQMTGDVKNPPKDIPRGSLAAILVSSAIYLMFAFVFSFTCTREALKADFMIAEKVSATQVLWLIGLYQLSLSSAVGNLCGCPTALMGVAADRVITFLNPLAKGTGPNKVPFLATSSLAGVSTIFLLFGHLNSLSVITTVLYLIAYAFVNYSYFELCMSIRQNIVPESNLKIKRKSDIKKSNEEPDKSSKIFPSYGSITKDESIIDPDLQKDVGLMFEMSVQWSLATICHPFVSLVGAVCCLASAFLIDWMYTLISLLCVLIVWFVIGVFNPGVPAGAAKFSYLKWARKSFSSLGRSVPTHENQFIITKPLPKMSLKITRQSLTNSDIHGCFDPNYLKLTEGGFNSEEKKSS